MTNPNQNPGVIKNNLVLELHVPDFAPAREFYGLFGFEELTYDPTSGGGSDLGYLVLARKDKVGDTMINFYGDKEEVSNHAHFRDFSADTPRGYEVEITIPVSDVNGLWEGAREELDEKQIAQRLELKRWGRRDFRVVDPYGFYVRFTELVDWGQDKLPKRAGNA
ncbi:hypothetical protein A3A68_01960 [Candidatus Saccharibacteria bacterium RIFCSPLOWO2_01_FULL_48_13]|nr:MAG: hypothetical protein A3A68_01960 [Candidatus Saccharibacteria bacterium RIFCSPLOWO2_01_FULL_48_13]